MSNSPHASLASFPSEYGSPARLIEWHDVDGWLESAMHYWLAVVRPDGRPHVVPLDGVWLDFHLYVGGSPTAVWTKCLHGEGRVVVHAGHALRPVIVEGSASFEAVSELTAQTLAKTSKAKYGYAPPAEAYLDGIWRLAPHRILAWTEFPHDATRFTFPVKTRSVQDPLAWSTSGGD